MGDESTAVSAWLRLSLIPELTGAALRALIGELGTPAQVFATPRSSLTRLVAPSLADAILRGPDAKLLAAAVSWAALPAHAIIDRDDVYYPRLLLETADPPPVLYAAGRLELLERPALAVVGSRNASVQGMRDAEAFARAFSQAGCCVVSGLALGIDTAAHRGGLAGPGSSIAVLGNGIDVLYPKRNAALSAQLMSEGLVLAEFALGTAPLAANFPRRNRLIAALARGCLVVEAAVPSGSLISARIAADLGRDVFAIPGSIHSPLAKGCHYLIKQGAKLVECAQDVLEELHIDAAYVPERAASVAHEPIQQTVLTALGFEPCSLDDLATRTRVPVDRLLATLTQLEIQGEVSALAGGRYQRIH